MTTLLPTCVVGVCAPFRLIVKMMTLVLIVYQNTFRWNCWLNLYERCWSSVIWQTRASCSVSFLFFYINILDFIPVKYLLGRLLYRPHSYVYYQRDGKEEKYLFIGPPSQIHPPMLVSSSSYFYPYQSAQSLWFSSHWTVSCLPRSLVLLCRVKHDCAISGRSRSNKCSTQDNDGRYSKNNRRRYEDECCQCSSLGLNREVVNNLWSLK